MFNFNGICIPSEIEKIEKRKIIMYLTVLFNPIKYGNIRCLDPDCGFVANPKLIKLCHITCGAFVFIY